MNDTLILWLIIKGKWKHLRRTETNLMVVFEIGNQHYYQQELRRMLTD